MNIAKQSVALVAGAFLFVAAPALSPVAAATSLSPSAITAAFLANVDANVAFLDHSSRLAAERTGSPAVRAFAMSESAEQAQVARALDTLVPGQPDAIASAAPEGDVTTGRSVAIDGAPAPATRTAANGRTPVGESALLVMTGLDGRAFDNFYWKTQLDALSQLEADYRAYIAKGDDPALVAMAQRELPTVMKRLEALSRI